MRPASVTSLGAIGRAQPLPNDKKFSCETMCCSLNLPRPLSNFDLSYSKTHILELFQKEFRKDSVKEIVLM